MTREEEYRLTLAHVVKWLSGDGGLDMMKPASPQLVNSVIDVINQVLDGASLEAATNEVRARYAEGRG